MKNKKLWVLLIVLILSVSLVSGCSQAEMGFIDLMGEMNDMDCYQSQETVNFSFSLGPALTKDKPGEIAVAQALLSKYYLASTTRVDAKKQIWDSTLFLVDSDSGTQKQIGSFVGSGGTLYLKVDDAIAFAKTLGNPEIIKQLAPFEGVEYISINSSEMAKLMDPSGNTKTFNIMDVEKQQALYKDLMEGLTQEAFDGYTTGMVEGSNNKYTMKIDKKSVLDNIEPFLVYSINNIEKIGAFSKDFLSDLDAEELALLSLNTAMRDEAVQGMDQLTAEVAVNRDLYLAQAGSFAQSAKEMSGMVGDSTGMTIVAEKVGEKNFKQKAEMVVSITPPEDPASSFSFEMNTEAEIKGIDTFSVEIPTSGVVSMTEILERMPRVMRIDTVNKQYFLTQGLTFSAATVDVRLVDGRTYLPVRAIGEAMNETVGWNPAIKSAYIVKDGKTINLKGNIYNSRAFIQIRDFEKIGYTVTWDSATKTATLSQ